MKLHSVLSKLSPILTKLYNRCYQNVHPRNERNNVYMLVKIKQMILGLKGESPTVDHSADVAQVGSCISVCELCYPNCTYTPGCGGALRLLTSADLSQAWPLRTTSDHRVWNATLRNTAEYLYYNTVRAE